MRPALRWGSKVSEVAKGGGVAWGVPGGLDSMQLSIGISYTWTRLAIRFPVHFNSPVYPIKLVYSSQTIEMPGIDSNRFELQKVPGNR